MTTEEKAALTGLCRIEIKRWKAAANAVPERQYMVALMELALAALTAEPAPETGWTGNSAADAALIMLDRINTTDYGDDDRIEGVKRVIRRMAVSPASVVPDVIDNTAQQYESLAKEDKC